MRNILLSLLALIAFSCSSPTNGVVTTFDDEKSNAIREHYQNYLKNDVPALQSLWSPDLKIYMNSVDASTVSDISELITVQHQVFDNISMSWTYDEMVVRILVFGFKQLNILHQIIILKQQLVTVGSFGLQLENQVEILSQYPST